MSAGEYFTATSKKEFYPTPSLEAIREIAIGAFPFFFSSICWHLPPEIG
jgi:hypothetical protein